MYYIIRDKKSWVVVDRDGDFIEKFKSREEADSYREYMLVKAELRSDAYYDQVKETAVKETA